MMRNRWSLKKLWSRLDWCSHFIHESIGWRGLLSVILVGVAIIIFIVAIGCGAERLALKKDYVFASEKAVHKNIEMPSAAQMAEMKIQKFYAAMPDSDAAPEVVGSIFKLAEKSDVSLMKGSYRLEGEREGLLQYKVNLPVSGSVEDIEKFLMLALQEFPSMALGEVQFKRENVTTTQGEVELKFVLFMRDKNDRGEK